jgi:hypothetical protein
MSCIDTKIRSFENCATIERNGIPVADYYYESGDLDINSDLTPLELKELIQTLMELFCEVMNGPTITLPENPAHIPYHRQ